MSDQDTTTQSEGKFPDEADRGDGQHDEHHHPEFRIYVNTRSYRVEGHAISFEDVVKLAYPSVHGGNNPGYTVTYQRGPGNKDGQLVAGQSVRLREDMIFDVTPTVLS